MLAQDSVMCIQENVPGMGGGIVREKVIRISNCESRIIGW